MSFRRHLSFAINRNTYLDNRLTEFTNVPMYTDNLLVKRNTDICGNLTVGHDIRAVSFYATGNYYLDNYVLVPAGTIIMSASINEPAGWLHCNGRLLQISLYPDLYNAIGTTYTTLSVPNSFQIPDLRGRVGVGSYEGASDATYSLTQRNRGDVSGAETHRLTVQEMPGHTHTYGDTYRTGNQSTDNAFGTETAANETATTETKTTASTGGGDAHNNMQPYVVIRYLIKY